MCRSLYFKWGKAILEVEENLTVNYRLEKKKMYLHKSSDENTEGLVVRWKQNVIIKKK